MRSESSRRRTGDRNPVPVVVLGTAGLLVVGTGLLAVPGGGAVAASAAGRVWLYALLVAAVVGALGAGDPDPAARRRCRRFWAAGIGLFVATLAAPLGLDAVEKSEAALPLLLAAVFAALLTLSLLALGILAFADRRRTARSVKPRRPGAGARSRAAGPPGSRRARP